VTAGQATADYAACLPVSASFTRPARRAARSAGADQPELTVQYSLALPLQVQMPAREPDVVAPPLTLRHSPQTSAAEGQDEVAVFVDAGTCVGEAAAAAQGRVEDVRAAGVRRARAAEDGAEPEDAGILTPSYTRHRVA